MRLRPNEDPSLSAPVSMIENDLFRTLRRTFEHFLQTEDPGKFSLKNEHYVPSPELELAVRNFCSGLTNDATFLVGPTGIGKSTLLRHTFGVSRAPTIVDSTLFMLYSLNQHHLNSEETLRDNISALLLEASWKLKGGEEDHFSEEDFQGLRVFIKSTSPDLLQDSDLDLSLPSLERTKKLARSKRHSYAFSQIVLKYFASQHPTIKTVVFILDDLEMKPRAMRELAVRNILETKACLSNHAGPGTFAMRVLIALRPETHLWMSRLEEVRTASFGRISYKTPVSIQDIFQKRFDAAFGLQDYEHIRDKSKLDLAVQVLTAVGEGISARHTPRIVRLHNYNIRDSISAFSGVVANRRWLQKDPEYKYYFSVDEYGFAVNQASALRALGMGSHNIYTGRDTCIANILWNTREENSDLILIYVIKYLLNKSNQPAARADMQKSILGLLWDGYPADVLQEIVDYAVENSIIFSEDTANGEWLRVSPRGQELYTMLGESTILLEMFRDDICLPPKGSRPARPTRLHTGAADAFCAVAELIESLWTSESTIRSQAAIRQATEFGSAYFGIAFECSRFRSAFERSMAAFYQDSDRAKWPPTVGRAMFRLSQLAVPEGLH